MNQVLESTLSPGRFPCEVHDLREMKARKLRLVTLDAQTRQNAEQQLSQAAEVDFVRFIDFRGRGQSSSVASEPDTDNGI